MIQHLEIVIEFAIGLSGFAGIVVLFGTESGSWREFDRFRIVNLISTSMTAALQAFICLLLTTFLDEAMVVPVASALLFLHLSLCLIVLNRFISKKSIANHPMMSRSLSLFFRCGIFISMAALLFNALPWTQSHYAIFLGSLIWLLTISGIQFIRILWSRPTKPEPSNS